MMSILLHLESKASSDYRCHIALSSPNNQPPPPIHPTETYSRTPAPMPSVCKERKCKPNILSLGAW